MTTAEPEAYRTTILQRCRRYPCFEFYCNESCCEIKTPPQAEMISVPAVDIQHAAVEKIATKPGIFDMAPWYNLAIEVETEQHNAADNMSVADSETVVAPRSSPITECDHRQNVMKFFTDQGLDSHRLVHAMVECFGEYHSWSVWRQMANVTSKRVTKAVLRQINQQMGFYYLPYTIHEKTIGPKQKKGYALDVIHHSGIIG